MTNEEAAKRILSMIERGENNVHDVLFDALTTREINALKRAYCALERDRWISVKERLPEDGKNVLCRIEKECMYYDDAGGEVFVMDSFVIEGHYRKGKYKGWYRAVAPDIGSYTNNVTHWMPLPEPPKEET